MNKAEQIKNTLLGFVPDMQISIHDTDSDGTVIQGEFSTVLINIDNPNQEDSWMISLNADPAFVAVLAPSLKDIGLNFAGPYCERLDKVGVETGAAAYVARQEHILAQAIIHAKNFPEEQKKIYAPPEKKLILSGARL